jgi:hypothetical protein
MPGPDSTAGPLNRALVILLAAGALPLAACGRNQAAPHGPGAWFHLASTPHLPLRVAADLIVKRAQFGILETTPEGEERFVPATEIPAEDGQVFGWVVAVDTSRASLHWQEHLKLPRPPADWGDAADDPDVLISKDGRSAVAQGEDAVEDGELSRFYWALAPGDPAGDYELDLAVEGKAVAHFAFRVPATVQEKPILVRNAPRPGAAPRLAALAPRPAAAGATTWR